MVVIVQICELIVMSYHVMCFLNPVSVEMWCLGVHNVHISSFCGDETPNSFSFLETGQEALLPGLGNVLKL